MPRQRTTWICTFCGAEYNSRAIAECCEAGGEPVWERGSDAPRPVVGDEVLLDASGLGRGPLYVRRRVVEFGVTSLLDTPGCHDWQIKLNRPVRLEEVWGEGKEPYERLWVAAFYLLTTAQVEGREPAKGRSEQYTDMEA